MTDTAASAPARAGATSWLGKLEGKLSWILLGLAGLALPLLDDNYIGVIAQRAYIYWVLSAGLNLVVGYAGQIAIGWVSMLTLGAYTTAALAAGRVGAEWNPYLALAAGGVMGAVFGVIVGLPALQAAHLLLRHDDLGLRHHRHPGGARLEGRHRRRRRHAGPDLPLAVRAGLGLLLFLLHPGGARDLDDGQHRLEPLRPRAGGDPRRRGRGRGVGHRQAQTPDRWSSCWPAPWAAWPAGCSPRCSPTSRPTPSPSRCRCCSSSPS